MRAIVRRFALAALVGFGWSLAGCGPPRGYVVHPDSGATLEGTVTYAGKKVMAALLTVEGANGMSIGFIGDDGRYHISNVPLGEVTIGVNTAAGKAEIRDVLATRPKGAPRPSLIDVPAKYADQATSGIKTTISKGPNTFDIVIP